MPGVDQYDGTEQYSWVLLEAIKGAEPMEVAAAPTEEEGRSRWRWRPSESRAVRELGEREGGREGGKATRLAAAPAACTLAPPPRVASPHTTRARTAPRAPSRDVT